MTDIVKTRYGDVPRTQEIAGRQLPILSAIVVIRRRFGQRYPLMRKENLRGRPEARNAAVIGVLADADHVRVIRGPCELGHGWEGACRHISVHAGRRGRQFEESLADVLRSARASLSNIAQKATRPA